MPPEKLLRALLLQALYTIRSERQLMEQLDYNLLFRWFVGLGMDDARLVADDLHARIATGCSTATSRAAFFEARAAPCRHRAAVVGRALHRRWHVARGVGQSQEFSARAIRIRRPTAGGNPTRQFPRAAAQQ